MLCSMKYNKMKYGCKLNLIELMLCTNNTSKLNLVELMLRTNNTSR
jgi:hypothetical protein